MCSGTEKGIREQSSGEGSIGLAFLLMKPEEAGRGADRRSLQTGKAVLGLGPSEAFAHEVPTDPEKPQGPESWEVGLQNASLAICSGFLELT